MNIFLFGNLVRCGVFTGEDDAKAEDSLPKIALVLHNATIISAEHPLPDTGTGYLRLEKCTDFAGTTWLVAVTCSHGIHWAAADFGRHDAVLRPILMGKHEICVPMVKQVV